MGEIQGVSPIMTYLPTFEDSVAIVAANDAFKHTIEEIDGYKIHTFNYRLPGYQDFMEPIKGNKTINALELRGLTFVEDNGLYHRYLMLPKFWCLNQTNGAMYNDVKDKQIVEITEKLDGSLIRFIRLPNGRIIAKSKGSAVGPHCEMALELLHKSKYLKDYIEAHLHKNGPDNNYAIICEMIGPDNEIVLKYEKPELRVVQIRHEKTGEFKNMTDIIASMRISQVINYQDIDTKNTTDLFKFPSSMSIDNLIDFQKTSKNVEGWVVRFSDGTLIKVKTNWYENMHRHFIEKQRGDRMYVEMTIDETIDDAISLMVTGDIRDRMIEVYEKVSAYFNATVSDVIKVKNTFTGDVTNKNDKSEFAKIWKDFKNFPLYMFAINNQDDTKIEKHIKGHILGQCKTDKDAIKFINDLKE
jgi:T4 RnlA family RNA ligase